MWNNLPSELRLGYTSATTSVSANFFY